MESKCASFSKVENVALATNVAPSTGPITFICLYKILFLKYICFMF